MNLKALRAGSHCVGDELCRGGDTAAGGESCRTGFFYFRKKEKHMDTIAAYPDLFKSGGLPYYGRG